MPLGTGALLVALQLGLVLVAIAVAASVLSR
jgi:hypothetical protein